MNIYRVVKTEKDGWVVEQSGTGYIIAKCALENTANRAAMALNACAVLIDITGTVEQV